MWEQNLVCYATLQFDREPWSLDNYYKVGGYEAWQRVLNGELDREAIIEEIKASGLRGRGGAGFPTGLKLSPHRRYTPRRRAAHRSRSQSRYSEYFSRATRYFWLLQ